MHVLRAAVLCSNSAGAKRPLVMLGGLFQLFDALGIVAAGSLRGAGDTRWPFVVQSSLAWLFGLPAAYVMGVLLDGGVTGAWMGMMAYVLVLTLALRRRFAGGAWRRIQI